MKKPLLFFLLVSLSLVSCKKNEDDKLDPDGDRFSAMIDGALFEANKVIATRAGTVLTISASSGVSGTPTFGMTVNASILGAYPIGTAAKVNAFYLPSAASTDPYTAKSGSLTIKEHDIGFNTMECTFSFTGKNAAGETIEVTDGTFAITYEE